MDAAGKSNLKMVSWLETHFVECLLFLFAHFRLQNLCRFENQLHQKKLVEQYKGLKFYFALNTYNKKTAHNQIIEKYF